MAKKKPLSLEHIVSLAERMEAMHGDILELCNALRDHRIDGAMVPDHAALVARNAALLARESADLTVMGLSYNRHLAQQQELARLKAERKGD